MNRRFAFVPVWIMILATMFVATAASAQNPARVDIPFAFTANHQVLQPGCYKVNLQSNAILTLVGCETGKTVGIMVHTANGYPPIHQGSLVFNVTPRGYRLTHVRFAFINLQSDLSVQPKPEEESASEAASKTIEIAMR